MLLLGPGRLPPGTTLGHPAGKLTRVHLCARDSTSTETPARRARRLWRMSSSRRRSGDARSAGKARVSRIQILPFE